MRTSADAFQMRGEPSQGLGNRGAELQEQHAVDGGCPSNGWPAFAMSGKASVGLRGGRVENFSKNTNVREQSVVATSAALLGGVELGLWGALAGGAAEVVSGGQEAEVSEIQL